jgi:sulfotransferase
MTTDSRMVHFSVSPPVGPSIEWLKDLITQKNDDKVLFIKFEDFCKNPDKEMKKLYNYIGLPYYKHDFKNVEQLTYENDVIHGIFGDHEIRGKVEPVKEDFLDVLGKANCDIIVNNFTWFYEKFGYKI